MAIYTNSSGVAYKAVVVVDPETGQTGTGGGIVTELANGVWGPEQFYQAVAVVDPETGLPTSWWTQSSGGSGSSAETFRLTLEDGSGYIVTQSNRTIKRG